MKGVVNFLKPPGMTSSDAVVWLRHQLGEKRIGHGGTLDPEAAGVLPILVGKAARLFDILLEHDKEYIAEAVFGVSTDTQDITGTPIRITGRVPSKADVENALSCFKGDIMQTPSAYSAIRVQGKKAYELARSGEAPKLAARPVCIDELELLGMAGNTCRLRLTCSRGTYVRALIHDLGEKLGCGAHMGTLVRTRSGPFRLENAVTVEQVKQDRQAVLQPMEVAVPDLARVVANSSALKGIANGNPIASKDILSGKPVEGLVRVDCDGEFLALGEWAKDGQVRIKSLLMGD